MKLRITAAVFGTAALLQFMVGGMTVFAAPDLSQQVTDQTLAVAINKLNSIHLPAGPETTMPACNRVPAQTAPAQSSQPSQTVAPAKSVQPEQVAQKTASPGVSVDKDEEKVITLDLRLASAKTVKKASSKKTAALKKRAAALKRDGIIHDSDETASKSDLLDRRRMAVASAAMGFRGTPYVWGGDSPGAFDCSGFTQYLYKKHFRINLPHNAAMQFGRGRAVSRGDLEVGDLVFFSNTGGRSGITHVGMYIGGGRFIHAANPRRGVRVDPLSGGYYGKSFAGGRRYR